DGETLPEAGRRVPDAEVVDGDADAGTPQLRELLEGEVGVLHGHALGDLQLQSMRIESGETQRRVDALDQRLLSELPGGEIDRNTKIGMTQVAECLGLQARGPQHPVSDHR